MSYNLFLDDERMPTEVTWENIPHTVEWTIVRNYREFCHILESKGLPEMVSFDHDLQDYSPHYPKERTGLDCARYMINFCRAHDLDLPNQYWVHSMSPVGRMNIRRELFSYEEERAMREE